MQLQTDLVRSAKGDIFTNSFIVAEKLEVPHKDLLRTIEKILEQEKSDCAGQPTQKLRSTKFISTMSEVKRWKSYPMYEMNEQAFTLLVMNLWRYKKAREIQSVFIDAFFKMRSIIQAHQNASWIESRTDGKAHRKLETDKIKEFVDYAHEQGNTKARWYYATITNMTYRALELLNSEKPVREILNSIGHTYLAVAEDQVAMALAEGMEQGLHYSLIYHNAKERLEKFAAYFPRNDKMLLTPLASLPK